jgi:hypothetical protein
MEARELRIGNLLLDNDKIICEVKEIRENYILTNSLDNFKTLVAQIGLYEPIPLTEEWLLRFGFKCVNGWDDQIYYQKKEMDLLVTLQGFEMPSGKICQYVHMLQNAYFFTELEELTTQELNQ